MKREGEEREGFFSQFLSFLFGFIETGSFIVSILCFSCFLFGDIFGVFGSAFLK